MKSLLSRDAHSSGYIATKSTLAIQYHRAYGDFGKQLKAPVSNILGGGMLHATGNLKAAALWANIGNLIDLHVNALGTLGTLSVKPGDPINPYAPGRPDHRPGDIARTDPNVAPPSPPFRVPRNAAALRRNPGLKKLLQRDASELLTKPASPVHPGPPVPGGFFHINGKPIEFPK